MGFNSGFKGLMVHEDVIILVKLTSREPFTFPHFSFSFLCLNFFLCFFYVLLHRALWYNYKTQTNEMHSFINLYLISDVSYMFRTSLIYPQGDSCICSTVCFTWICVSSPVGTLEHTLLPTRLLTQVHVKRTALYV